MTNYSLLISCPITSSRRTFLPPQGTLHHQIHGVLEVSGDLWTWSSPTPLLKARPTTAACSGPCPVRLWASPKMQVPQWFWAAWSCSVTLTFKKKNILCLNGSSCVSNNAHGVLSFHWAPERRVWVHPTPSDQVLHTQLHTPEPLLLRDKNPNSLNFSLYDRCYSF